MTDYPKILKPQWRQLSLQIRHARKSIYYRNRIPAAAENIHLHRHLLQSLPITTKAELVKNNLDFLAVNPSEIREWVTTSGTTGQPVRIALAEKDMDRLAKNEAAALSLAGLRAGDGLLIAVGMDRLFVAGLAYWLGAQACGALTLRVGPSLVDLAGVARLPLAARRRWFLIGVPSLLVGSLQNGVTLPQNLGGIIGIGEALFDAEFQPNAVHRALSQFTRAPILSTYASTEVCCTFAQGPKCLGNHLNPQMGVIEILDSGGRYCPPGVPGRVVITSLGLHAMPLIRFDTGDIAAFHPEPCPCGRSSPRLGQILGRSTQLLKVQGVSIFATAIIELLRDIYAGMDAIIHADQDAIGVDRVVIYVVCPPRRQNPLRTRFHNAARHHFKWIPKIQYCDVATIARIRSLRPSRKPQIFIDTRSR
ncbi:MAG: phenylacetate--CoA ligase family protein [Phycisphaerae bacterium]